MIPSRILPHIAAAGFCLAASCLAVSPAAAQQVVARVNGEPITAVDLAQRIRLLQISGTKSAGRQEVLDELIDEALKLQTARRYRIEISDAEVDQTVSTMASRMRVNSEQFARALGSAGVSIGALKRKLRADLAWSNIVRGKFQASLQIREKDVVAALSARQKGEDGKASFDYTLRPILFVVPRGADNAAFEARRREAEGLRSRFQNCEDGLRLVQGLRDMAVRPPIIRNSGDLSNKLREVIDAIPVGKLTPPDITASGVEVFAICEKKAGKAGGSGAERDMRDEMFGERFQAKGKQYLKELRRSASIEIK